MTQPQAAGVMVVVGLGVLVLMWLGWRGRQRRTAPLVAALPNVPDEVGPAIFGPIEGVYVSSTTHGDWLDRVNAADLGTRSRVAVSVHQSGIFLDRSGAASIFIPRSSVLSAQLAPGIAGKFTGKDGIVVISWGIEAKYGEMTALDTGLRTDHKNDRTALVEAITALQGQAKESL
ncbi:hypothetical protein [Jonesia quinghaiensis]|uniref:PH-like domain-containing protein n=1 Tax=Jonesia quinghaiensis TaxID=262806 RepID=UPI00040F47F1|nr:hypothetical protein [Jonesia quinghaiensis]